MLSETRITRSSVHRILKSVRQNHTDCGLCKTSVTMTSLIVFLHASPSSSKEFREPLQRYLFLPMKQFLFTDGSVNRHSCIIWDYVHPTDHATTADLLSKMVCCLEQCLEPIGPYFFKGLFDGRKYCAMLRDYAFPGIREAVGRRRMSNPYFTQDGAPHPNWYLPSREAVIAMFGERSIGCGLPIH